MAVPNVPDLYPFSTKQGQVIPLDIIRSKGLVVRGYSSTGETLLTLPKDSKVALFYADTACYLVPNAPAIAVDGTYIPDALFIPEKHVLAASVDYSSYFIRGLTEAGTLVVQVIEQWAGVGLAIDFTRR